MLIQVKDATCNHPAVLRQFCVKCYEADYYRAHGEFPPIIYSPMEDGVPADVISALIAGQGPLN